MPLWKTADTSTDDAKPLSANNDPHMDLNNVFANNSGWIHRVTYTDTHGNTRNKDEVMVAINGLAGTSPLTKLGQPTISDVRWSRSTVGTTGAAANIIVTFNEKVNVISANVLTISVGASNTTSNVIGGAGTNANTGLATYISGSGTNRLRFALTIDANAATYSLHTTTISNTAALALVDNAAQTLTANLSIVAAHVGANSAVGTLTAS